MGSTKQGLKFVIYLLNVFLICSLAQGSFNIWSDDVQCGATGLVGTDYGNVNNFMIIQGATINKTCDSWKIKLQSGHDASYHYPYPKASFCVLNSLVEGVGTGQLICIAGSNITLYENGDRQFDFTAVDEELWSETINFPLNNSNNYIIKTDEGNGGTGGYYRINTCAANQTHGRFSSSECTDFASCTSGVVQINQDSLKLATEIECLGSPPAQEFKLYSYDLYNGTQIQSFSVSFEGNQTYSTTTGSITTNIYDNSPILWNFTVTSTYGGGYWSKTFSNINVSTLYNASMVKVLGLSSMTLSNYTGNATHNYTRMLRYSITATCPTNETNYLNTYVDNTLIDDSALFSCNNQTQITITGNYKYSTEGLYNIWFMLNSTYNTDLNNESTRSFNFISDLYNPNITQYNFTVGEGFNDTSTNVTLRCYDNIMGSILYNITFNNALIIYGNETNNTIANASNFITNGDNTIRVSCSDLIGTSFKSYTSTVNYATIYLIDEVLNIPFDVGNISGAKLYYDDNSSYFDFKATNTNLTNFTSSVTNNLRLELIYSDGGIVTRWIDTELVNGSIRICANKEGRTHVDQLIISNSQKKVAMKNVFSQCYVAADKTRFAYQDAYALVAWTISSNYYLYTYTGNDQVFLTSVDGSIYSNINLDTIEFSQKGYNIDISPDSLVFSKSQSSPDTIIIRYTNIDNDNTALAISITNKDDNTLVFNNNEFSNYNNVTINFDYSLYNVSSKTIFKINVLKTVGTTSSTITSYFNTMARTGIISPAFTLIISIIILFFGLTFASTSTTMSWFGIVILIGNIAFLSLSSFAWYIIFMMAINIIFLIFIALILGMKNYPTVA